MPLFVNIAAKVPMAKVAKDEATAKAKDVAVDEAKERAAPKDVDEAQQEKGRVTHNFHNEGR